MTRLVLSLAFAITALGQTVALPPVTPGWRSNITALPASPPPNTTAQDVAEFEKNMRVAATYMGRTTPDTSSAQWQANRDMVKRMAAYLYGLQAMSGDRRLRGAVTHAQRSFDSLGFSPYLAYALTQGQQQQAAPPDAPPREDRPALQPPFDLSAPELTEVSEADKAVADELRTRYETDAAHSAGIWSNAEVIRQNLELRGMSLNLETSTAMMRLTPLFRSAATALRNFDWESARTHLERAEAETEKMAKTVGR